MIVVNLQQIGPVPPRFCSPEELGAVLDTATELLDEIPEEVITEILCEWETALTWRSMESEPVDEEWYYRALLVTCCRGLRGEMRPSFYTITK